MTIQEAKALAKKMQKETNCGHSKALNLIAKGHGYKSWTALLANTQIFKVYNQYKRDEK